MAQGTLDGWFKKQKIEPVADASLTEQPAQKQEQCDTTAEGTRAPTPVAAGEPAQATHMQASPAETTAEADASSDTPAVAQSLKGAVFAVVGADGPEVQLLLGAGVTVLDEYSALMCTHLLCEDKESSEANRALADGVQVVGRPWVREACQGCSPAVTTSTPGASTEAPAEYRIPAEYCLPDDYVDAWDREHVRRPAPLHCMPPPPHRAAAPRAGGAVPRRAVPRLPAPVLAPPAPRLAPQRVASLV